MSAAELQSLLRFLSQEAKVPLATAIAKVKDLQKANLGTPEDISKKKSVDLIPILQDEKTCKQVVTAAKRVTKKRGATGDDGPSTPKKRKTKNESLFAEDTSSPIDMEKSLLLPSSNESDEDLANAIIFSNRAPLVLAFVVTLLKYTMPEQPLSSRLSLAQAYVSTTSRARAVNLGIESGLSAEEEGFGEGQPFVTVMAKKLHILRRWDYEWQASPVEAKLEASSPPTVKKEDAEDGQLDDTQREPALWALDLEALKKSNTINTQAFDGKSTHNSGMPIYTPQSARAYLLKSFDSPPPAESSEKKPSAAVKAAEKERNLGRLLRSLDLVYESWSKTLKPHELDNRTWGWYVRVRPSVEDGVAGWGGKNRIRLADVLALRR